MKTILISLTLFIAAITSMAAPTKKIIDNGGSGEYKAEAIAEPTLPGFVIYKPQDMRVFISSKKKLPLLVFANGGCNDTSLPYEKMLNDIASYGYLIIALGEMQETIDDRILHKSPNKDMINAIDWAEQQNHKSSSPYYNCIDLEHIALAGQSCGGAQVLANCSDARIKTYILLNSGIGNMEMAEANKKSLKKLHSPILYITGGENDIAYQNAVMDYENITHVPIALANQLQVGHGGTFHEQYGGSFSHMVRLWLDWHLKKTYQNKKIFLQNQLNDFPDYTMEAKNFPETNTPYITKEIHCKSRDGKDIWGVAYIPNTKEKKKPITILAHGYNGTHKETQSYAQCLAMRGIACYIFDFCGGGNYSKSEGKTTEMTIFSEKENIEDITNTIKSWSFVDSTRIALLGCSQGGLVAALTAAYNPKMFNSLVLVYPALLIPETAPHMLDLFSKHDNEPQEVMGMKLGRIYYEKINQLPVLDIIGKFKGKTFIIYGDKDKIIAGKTLQNTLKRYDQHEVTIIQGGNHGFSNYQHHAQATKEIVKFLLKAMSK